MKLILLLSIVFLFVDLGSARADLTDKQIIDGYYKCMAFNKDSKKVEQRIAKECHLDFNALVRSCRFLSRHGLKQILELDHEYYRSEREGSDDNSNPGCISSKMCGGDSQCINGTCQSVPGGCDNGPNSCAGGETCTAGVCH